MAKRSKVLPARKLRDRSRDDDSLLLRSAESLGRVISALQRQLDGATRRRSQSAGNGDARVVRRRVAVKSTTKRPRAAATKHKSIKKR